MILKNQLQCAFEKHNLKLVSREISTENDDDQLEFLDFKHVIEK